MHAYASSSRGQARSSSVFAPAFRFSDSRSSSSIGNTPEEGLRATRYLAGAAKIWMCLEKGKYIRNASTLPSAPQKPKMRQASALLEVNACESSVANG